MSSHPTTLGGRRSTWILALLATTLPTCEKRSAHRLAVGEACDEDADCEEGRCEGILRLFSACTRSCAEEACPDGTVCGTDQEGARICVLPCDYGDLGQRVVCDQGVPIACAHFDREACEDCGCADEDFCSDDGTCVPELQLGSPCEQDWQCRSESCGVPADGSTGVVCLVALGEPCTDGNCSLCIEGVCSQWCAGCDHHAGARCDTCRAGTPEVYCVDNTGTGAGYRCLLECRSDDDCDGGATCQNVQAYGLGGVEDLYACEW